MARMPDGWVVTVEADKLEGLSPNRQPVHSGAEKVEKATGTTGTETN